MFAQGRGPRFAGRTIMEDLRRRDFSLKRLPFRWNPPQVAACFLDPTTLVDIEARRGACAPHSQLTNQPVRLVACLCRFAARMGFSGSNAPGNGF